MRKEGAQEARFGGGQSDGVSGGGLSRSDSETGDEGGKEKREYD